MTEREAVARIIDPGAWDPFSTTNIFWLNEERNNALAKADAILARQEGLVEALRELIEYFDHGDFEPGCSECQAIAKAKAALLAYDQAKGGAS